MALKPAKTAADYMAMTVCPALIMVLVGSQVFFLLQAGYAGEFLGRIRWTLFWFVFAMVLVSRIAIEKSQGAAFLYGLALAGATSIMLSRYLGFNWGVWVLLALIWWASNKIVWDCTLIDEDQDASGEGLLRMSRLRQPGAALRARVRAVPAPGSELSEQTNTPRTAHTPGSRSAPALPAPRRLSPGSKASPRVARKPPGFAKTQDVHAPGLWVLYFSFAAVPVFGVGELFLAANDSVGRRACFLLLCAYLCSALGLLLLTSFLGLRRYLRQRYLIMPASMARSWVTKGGGLLVIVMLLAVLLPRPSTPYSVAALVTKLSSPPPSQGSAETSQSDAEGSRLQSGRSRSKAAPGSAKQQSDESAQPTTDRPSEPADGAEGRREARDGTASSGLKPPPMPTQFATWLPYLVAAIVLAVVLYRFWPEISAGLASLFGSFAGFRMKRRGAKGNKRQSTARAGRKADALLPDPFRTGQAGRMSLPELVLYSFDGLKRWGEARGFDVVDSETPFEFAERLSKREPAIANEILLVSRYFSHVVYANQSPNEEAVPVLKRLWSVVGFPPNPPGSRS